MKVTNINGVSDPACRCGSWLNHWQNFSGQQMPPFCPEASCSSQIASGAHVQKDNPADRGWYVVPLCSAHDALKGGALDLTDNVYLVTANVAETCGKA